MTDRELLELAAKAAGIEAAWRDGEGLVCRNDAGYRFFWNPLTDDGDALRLAVRLRKLPVIEHWSDGDYWVYTCGHEGEANPLGNDPYAATRRAIVRAAAEIGRSKT